MSMDWKECCETYIFDWKKMSPDDRINEGNNLQQSDLASFTPETRVELRIVSEEYKTSIRKTSRNSQKHWHKHLWRFRVNNQKVYWKQ